MKPRIRCVGKASGYWHYELLSKSGVQQWFGSFANCKQKLLGCIPIKIVDWTYNPGDEWIVRPR